MAEPWVQITAAKFKTRLGTRELAVLSQSALADNAEAVLTQCVRTVVQKVRGYIRTCTQNSLGPDGYVPPELEAETYALLLEEAATRLPLGSLVLDEARQRRIDNAYRILRDVASCKFLITAPETTSTTSPVPDGGGYGGPAWIDVNPYVDSNEPDFQNQL